MYLCEAISKRTLELCNIHKYTPNKLAELSGVPPSTMKDLINERVSSPSTVVIYKITNFLGISLRDFFDSDLFNNNFED